MMKAATLRKIPVHLLLAITSLAMMYPLIYGLVASFSTPAEYIRSTWMPFPGGLNLKNYADLFNPRMMPLITRSVGITLFRTLWYIVFTAITSILCGYVFARLRFRGKEAAFLYLLCSMLVPGIVFQVPIYVMMARWPLVGGNNILGQGGSGFINQMPSLLLGGLVSAYFIFLMRQSFYSIPPDYEEAARIDGANTLQVLQNVYLPMLLPVLVVIVIGTFVGNWNDYVWPLMAVGGDKNFWPVGLLFQRLMAGAVPVLTTTTTTSNQLTNTPLLLTAGTVATIPPVLCFFIFQRYFIEGMQGVGIKG
jgi:multiple sugar transport system permease protein